MTSPFSTQGQVTDQLKVVTNGSVNTIVTDESSKKIYFGGDFTKVGPKRVYATLFNKQTGQFVELDKFDDIVTSSVSDGAGGYFVGGRFKSIGSANRQYLAHLDATGQVTSWGSALKLNGAVSNLFRIGTKLYVAGEFTGEDAVLTSGAIFDQNDYSAISGFPNINGSVSKVISDEAGGWYIAGDFSSVGGIARSNLAHINSLGSVTSFFEDQNIDGTIRDLELTGSNLVVAGDFEYVNRIQSHGVVLDNTNAVLENNPLFDYAPSIVVSDGSGGWIMYGNLGLDGVDTGDLTHLKADGTYTSINLNADSDVEGMVVSGNTIYLYGTFTELLGAARSRLAAVDLTDLSLHPDWKPTVDGQSGTVSGLTVVNSNVAIFGDFKRINGGNSELMGIVDGSTGQLTSAPFPVNLSADQIKALAFDNNVLYASIRNAFTTAYTLKAFDATTSQLVSWSPSLSVGVKKLLASGGKVFASCEDGALYCISASTGSQLWSVSSNGTIYDIAIRNTKAYLAGSFNQLGGNEYNYVGAVDISTGTIESVPINANGTVDRLSVSGSNMFLGGQAMSKVGGDKRERVLVVNTVTSVIDSWAAAISGPVWDVEVVGSNLIVGGEFTQINLTSRGHLASLSLSGATLQSWAPDVNGNVTGMATDGNTLFYSGDFSQVDGQSRTNLAASEVATGNLTSWNPQPDGAVHSLFNTGSSIFCYGGFQNISGQGRDYIAEFDFLGNITSWQQQANLTNEISVAAYAGDEILIRTSLDGIETVLALSTATGGRLTWQLPSNASSMAWDDSNTIFIGQSSVGIKTNPFSGLVLLDATTGAYLKKDFNLNGNVMDFESNGTTLFVAGTFTRCNNSARVGLVALDGATGNNISWDAQSNSSVLALGSNSTTLYATGNFTNIGGQARNKLAGLDLTTGLATGFTATLAVFGAPAGSANDLYATDTHLYVANPFGNPFLGKMKVPAGTVQTIVSLPDNKVDKLYVDGTDLYMTGDFTGFISGSATAYLSGISMQGDAALPFDAGMNGKVATITINGDQVFIGGSFIGAGMVSRARLAAVDATTGQLLPWAPEAGGTVNKMLKNGDQIYVAGNFQGVGIENRYGLASVSATTGSLSNWNPSPSGFVALNDIVADKGKFYLAGDFTQINGTTRNYVARIDSLTGVLDSWAPNPDNKVTAIDVKDEIVYLAGTFNNVNSTTRKTMAAVSALTGSLTNWNPGIFLGPWPMSTGVQALSQSVVVTNGLGILVTGLDGTIKQTSTFSTVNRLVRRDDQILVMGSFTSLGSLGSGVTRFASFSEQNGALVLDSYPRYDVTGGIYSYAQIENKLVIGGQITGVNGQVVGNIALVSSPFQVITVTSPGTKALGSGTFNLGASISSGQTMTFASSDENVATINSQGDVTIVGIGSVDLTISQAGGSDFQPVSTSVPLKIIASDPLTPTNLQFSNVLATSMNLNWDAPSGNPAGYMVLARTDQAPTAVPLDETTYAAEDVIGDSKVVYVGTSPSFALSSLTAGSEYFFTVYSFNGTGAFRNYSAASAAGSSFTLPQSPSLNDFSGIDKDAFVINWGAITGAQGYKLDISTDNFATFVTGYESKQLGAVNTTSVSGVESGTQYNVRLAAFNAAGVSAYSTTASVLTKPRIPGNLSFSAVKSTGFTLSWDTQTGVDNYFVDLSTDNFQTLLPGFSNFSLSNVAQYVFTGLQSEVRYYVRLRASNASGLSDNSMAAEQVTFAQQPIAQPTSLTFDNVTSTELRGTFVVANGSPAGYLVLMSETKNPEQVPVDGVSYLAGTMIGDEKVVFAGSGNSFTVSGLSAASKYYFAVFSYGGSGAGTNYLEAAPLFGSRATLALQPESQPSGLAFASVGTTTMDLSFIAAAQATDRYLVLARSGLAVADLPTDGTNYTSGTTIGQSTVVFAGVGLTFEVASLVPGTTYHYAIFAFNGTDETTNYLVTDPLIGSKTTLALEPASQATNLVFSNITPGNVRVSWTNSVGNGRVLLARKLNLSAVVPTDGTTYTANQNFETAPDLGDGSRVLYTGTSNTADISGLEPESVYAFKVLEWSGAGESTNYLGISNTGNPATMTTLALPPESQPGEITFSDVTENSMKVSFVPSSDVSPQYLVIRKNGSAPTEAPVDGTGYSEGDVMGQSLVVYVGTGTSFAMTELQPDVTYHYAVFVYYGDQATANYLETPSRGSRATLKVTKFEMTAPRMDAQRAFAAGNTIEVDVTGATGTLQVTLHWRTITAPGAFGVKNMTLKTGATSTYSVTLTEDMRDEMGMEFFVTATDATTTIPTSETHYYLYRVFPATEAIPFVNQFDGTEKTYQMFSIPYVPTDASIANIFNELGAYNKDVWRLYHYEPSRDGNVEFLSGLSNQISPGKGYWFNAVSPLAESVQVGVGKVVEANQSQGFKVNLEKGWNQIGNPLPFDVDWQAIRDRNSDAGLNRLWYYAGANATPFSPDPVLRTWKGGFVFSDAGGEVEFPVLSRSSGRIATETLGTDLDGENWKIDLHLETDLSGAEARIGMHPNARTAKDKFDEIALPRFFSHLEMTTLHPEFFAPRFMNDVAPPLSEYTWVFSLSASHTSSSGKITWNREQLLQAQAAIMLIDLESQTWVDMKTTGEYSFSWKEGRQIKIVYSKDGVAKPGLTLGGIAYPSPFQSSVAVRILSDGGAIQMSVFDQLGRKIRTINTVLDKAGLGEVVWDGKDDLGETVPSGTYLYRLYDAGGKFVSVGRFLKK